MAYWTYILQSETTGRYYCGSTSDLKRRVQEHNDPKHQLTKTTKRFAGPWILVHSETFDTRTEARKKEIRIKKRGIGRYLNDQQTSF